MNEERITKKVLNMKVTGKYVKGRPSDDGNSRLGKMSYKERENVE
jgi:hypothetical protein